MTGLEKEALAHPLKIAFCLPDHDWLNQMANGSPTDAAHIQQLYIVNGLRARGHRLTFLAPRELNWMLCASDLTQQTLASQTWTSSKWFDFIARLVWKIQQWLHVPYLNFFSNLRRYDAALHCLAGHDLVFERNSLYNVGVAMACKKLCLPYVMFFDADQIAEQDFMGKPITGLLRWRAKQLLRYNLKIADRVICVSEPAKRHLMTNWNVPMEKIEILPNAVDIHRFRPDPSLRAATRASLRLEANPLILFVGSFYPWHDVATLLKAFAAVLAAHREARLILVGEGTEREKMMRYAADLQIEDAVKFTGFIPHEQVSNMVNAADIAVVPVPKMEQEMWLSPMKLFEYMASGKAIVASAMGQIANVIRDGQNGLLVPAGDVQALTDALRKLIEDAELRERLGAQAREDAMREYSWERYVLRLEKVFDDARSTHHTRKNETNL